MHNLTVLILERLMATVFLLILFITILYHNVVKGNHIPNSLSHNQSYLLYKVIAVTSDHHYFKKNNLFVFLSDNKYTIDKVLNMEKDNNLISAEVILKTESGRSVLKEGIPVISENIEQFQPSNKIIKDASNRLEKLNFTVFNNNITLTIYGKVDTFEKVFNLKLDIEKDTSTGQIKITPNKKVDIPNELTDIIEEVIFTPPPTLYK